MEIPLSCSEIKLSLVKELTEVLRDKRTLIIMIFLPVVVCPLLSLMPIFMANQVTEQAATKKTSVRLLGEGSAALRPYFADSKRIKIVETVEGNSKQPAAVGPGFDVLVQTFPEFASDLAKPKPVQLKIIDS